MSFDIDSFMISETALQEIEQEANLITKTPLSAKNQNVNESMNIEVIEESPDAREYMKSFRQKSLRERSKHISTQIRKPRKLEKTRSDFIVSRRTLSNGPAEISSISKYLRAEDIDFSAWERSAAKLISPAVEHMTRSAFETSELKPPPETIDFHLTDYDNLQIECSVSENTYTARNKSRFQDSPDLFTEEPALLDQAISGESDRLEISTFHDIDSVSFLQPREEDAGIHLEATQFIEEELVHQKSILQSMDFTFQNKSVISQSQNAFASEKPNERSMILDTTKNLLLLSNWNLPPTVVNEYRKKKVTEMFQWQCECLQNPKVLFDGSNLVYSAPTSAGKTLVSEILMIKNIVELKKKVLFILPFVSVVREKMFYLQDLMTSSGMRVEGFFGGYHPPGGFESINLAVCTIEKANSIINRLLEQNKLGDVGMIVIDEIHLISDSSRGYILELLLTKILYMCDKFKHRIQLITMSATLPNVDILRKWLRAEYYYTDFRPIELRESIKINKNIYDPSMKLIREIREQWKEFFQNDSDNISELVMETLLEKCQLIIFCPSKEQCESLCTNLARGIFNINKLKPEVTSEIFDKAKMEIFVEQLKNLTSGLDMILQRCIPYGCAFHHAGLTTDERDMIEMGFKEGYLKVLVATSTLSSGVNLPARRVIIRTPMFGKSMMSNLTYRQMIGRAGRKGKDVLGESILVCNDSNSRIGKQLVFMPLDPITSCLDVDNHSHLKRALLEIIASGVASKKHDLENFLNFTLYCQQHSFNFSYFQEGDEYLRSLMDQKGEKIKSKENCATDDNSDPVKSSMDFLLEYEFIRLHLDDDEEINFVPTRLGIACLSSSIPPKDGFLLFSELQKSRQNFVLESELHAIYLVTPFTVAYQLADIDWMYFVELHDKLPEMMKRVGAMVGVSDTYLIKAITGKQGSDWRAQQIHKRFYTALALQELVNEKSITEVAAKYKLPRGLLQNLQQMASTFSGIVTTFCQSLNWNLLALILAQFRERLFFGIHPDLIDLMKLPSMSSTRIARSLYSHGIQKLTELANCRTLDVENALISTMDSGGNFFVTGKSMALSVQETAKLLISDARNHIQNEMGIKNIAWQSDSLIESPPDEQKNTNEEEKKPQIEGNSKKRKAEMYLISPESTDGVGATPRNKRAKHNTSIDYRRKLRSSGGQIDLVQINTQFMENLEKKANRETMLEISDRNDSMFEVANSTKADFSENVKEFTQNFLKITDVLADIASFEKFRKELDQYKELAISVGIVKFKVQAQTIGGNVLRSKGIAENFLEHKFIYDNTFYIDSICFYCPSNDVFHLNLQKVDKAMMQHVKTFLIRLIESSDITLNIYEAREHLKVLCKALNLDGHVNVKICDPRMASWMIDPDKNLTWHQMIEKFVPEHLDILETVASTKTICSLGLNYASKVEPKVRTAVESFIVHKLITKQLEAIKKTGKGNLVRVLRDLEMSIQIVLMRMEMSGFPINEKKLHQTIEETSLVQRQLEQHIYEINGRKFNLSSSKEVSKVVGIHRNLQKKKVSTAKNVLEKLDLPIANCIMQWRSISTTLSNMQPMIDLVRNERIYGNSFSLTQTGRISMYEPNLQNVTKNFHVEFTDKKGKSIKKEISFRKVFECRKGKLLLAADFCQLELRILTHLSKDPVLVAIMQSSNEDIFRKIAAKWNKVLENKVTDVQRNQTKQLCYGIIYGMGNKALAETMKIDEEASAKVVEEFHATYPGIKKYSQRVVQKTREQGYIETVTTRRRYLPAINSENSSERSQAERQALNTTIQGSASDLVKNAILRMERNIRKHNLQDSVRLVLHLHDELFYEVCEANLNEASKILIQSMENCVKLTVPLLVKLKSGTNWGEMHEIDKE